MSLLMSHQPAARLLPLLRPFYKVMRMCQRWRSGSLTRNLSLVIGHDTIQGVNVVRRDIRAEDNLVVYPFCISL